jgi:hypothetical protein
MGYDHYVILQVVVGSISNTFTLWQLHLIRKMQLNGFLILILALAVATFLHDSVYYFQLSGDQWGKGFSSLFSLYFGCMMGVWTNAMSLTLFRIVYSLQSVNIVGEFQYYFFFAFVFLSPWAIYSLVTYGLTTDVMTISFRAYYVILFVEVILNFLLYASTVVMTRNLYIKVDQNILSQKQADYITEIVGRMKWFGLIQILSRIETMWYYFNTHTTKSRPARYIHAIWGPVCGLLYFFVFLYVQPSAREAVISKLTKLKNKLFSAVGQKPKKTNDPSRAISYDSSRITEFYRATEIGDLMCAFQEEEKTRSSIYGGTSPAQTPNNRVPSVELTTNPLAKFHGKGSSLMKEEEDA